MAATAGGDGRRTPTAKIRCGDPRADSGRVRGTNVISPGAASDRHPVRNLIPARLRWAVPRPLCRLVYGLRVGRLGCESQGRPSALARATQLKEVPIATPVTKSCRPDVDQRLSEPSSRIFTSPGAAGAQGHELALNVFVTLFL
jgi:hypothetical protein